MNSTLKSLLFWLVIVVILAGIWQFSAMQRNETPISFTQFMANVKSGAVGSVAVRAPRCSFPASSRKTSTVVNMWRQTSPTFSDLGLDARSCTAITIYSARPSTCTASTSLPTGAL